jgi:hypothetical protein
MRAVGRNDDSVTYLLPNDCGQDLQLTESIQVLLRQEVMLAVDRVLILLDPWNGVTHVFAKASSVTGLEDPPHSAVRGFTTAGVQQDVVGATEVHV